MAARAAAGISSVVMAPGRGFVSFEYRNRFGLELTDRPPKSNGMAARLAHVGDGPCGVKPSWLKWQPLSLSAFPHSSRQSEHAVTWISDGWPEKGAGPFGRNGPKGASPKKGPDFFSDPEGQKSYRDCDNFLPTETMMKRLGTEIPLAAALVLAVPLAGSAEPRPGDVFRESLWTKTDGDAGGTLRVGGRLGYGVGPVTLPQELDLTDAIRAEVVIEKLLCHDGTRGRARPRVDHRFRLAGRLGGCGPDRCHRVSGR